MPRRPLVLDSDPGLDDAAALHYLLARPEWELLAYTAVGGNVPVDLTFRNARALAAAFGIDHDVPVYRGAGRPISRVPIGGDFHGASGLGSAELPDSAVPEQQSLAPLELLRLSHVYENELTVVATGPLTNIAAALILDPEFARRVAHLVFMGGAALVPGNITSVAEFNIWADPDAADLVVASGIPYTMVGLDVTHHAPLTADDVAKIDAAGTDHARLTAALLRDYLNAYLTFTGRDHGFLHDPLAIGVASDESFAEVRTGCVVVGTDLGLHRGQTVFIPDDAAQTPFLTEATRARTAVKGNVAVAPGRSLFPADFVSRLRQPLQ
ncbi:nucleoside hydrolase [Catenulispora yoronensis]|uniref:Nucleoside hydrolase n=1 Tax=Catenulispora yoronensis TaxID=450799 RepID=A0ABN2UD50_9ACTN